MTETLRRVLKQNATAAISTEEAELVAEMAIDIAAREQIECAIAGGLAMHLYGFTRQTTDVDLIAARRLPLSVSRYLSFGGESYLFQLGDKTITVNWIVRRDADKRIYQAALADADVLENGWQIVKSESLVVMKYAAGRAKDNLDIQFLLQQPDLVDRRRIKKNLENLFGIEGARGYLIGLRRFYDLADLNRVRDGDENESYGVEE